MKKILSLLLSAVMLVSASFGTCVSAFADENIFGLDVSEHNELVNFVDAKDNNKNFVMIRLGYVAQNKWILDKKFWENVKNAHNAQMDFGIYFYSYAFNAAEAQYEAEFVIDTLAQLIKNGYGKYFTLPVAFDLEDKLISDHCNKTQITKVMTTFCDTVKNAGYVPMVYANLTWFTNYIDINTAVSKNYKLWYAYWQSGTPDFSKQIEIGKTGIKADMWQYVDATDKYAKLDKNVIYHSDELIKPLACLHSYTQKTVAATCKAQGYTLHTCSKCKKSYKTGYTAKKAHTYKTTTTKATMSKAGSVVTKCSACGYKKSSTTIYSPKTVKLTGTSYVYNGKVKTPGVTVKNSRGTTLKKDKDYTVSYAKGRKNAGRYSVKVTFKGKYSGSKTLYYNIVPKGTTVAKLTGKSKGLRVQWKTQKSQTTGYQIQYSTGSNFKNGKTITIKKNGNYAKNITKLKGKKKYYVRIRTYKTIKFNGKNYNLYSSWSKAKAITTKK